MAYTISKGLAYIITLYTINHVAQEVFSLKVLSAQFQTVYHLNLCLIIKKNQKNRWSLERTATVPFNAFNFLKKESIAFSSQNIQGVPRNMTIARRLESRLWYLNLFVTFSLLFTLTCMILETTIT